MSKKIVVAISNGRVVLEEWNISELEAFKQATQKE